MDDGVYTYSEAAAILGRGEGAVSGRRVRYWVNTGLTPPSHRVEGLGLLSFEDLVSLEIVRRFVREDVSLHKIRRLEARLRSEFENRERPLAWDVFFTDGATIWAKESGDSDAKVIEVVGKRPGHYAWVEGIATFAEEIRFSEEGGRAVAWEPHPNVTIDPSIQFGTPVVSGTRIPVRTIITNLTAGTPEEVASWYALSVEQVTDVRDYLAAA